MLDDTISTRRQNKFPLFAQTTFVLLNKPNPLDSAKPHDRYLQQTVGEGPEQVRLFFLL